MTAHATINQNSVVPLLRYRDLARAMEWLAEVFGFEKQLAVSDPTGEVIYGQMRYGTSLIMLGTVRDTDLDGYMTQPDEVGGFETQTCYVVIDNAEEHFSRTVMAGADIILELKSDPHGRRGYACRDPEGHIWNFGTFHPTMTSLTSGAEEHAPEASQPGPWRTRLAIAASLILALMTGFVARDFVASEGAMSVAAEEGSADYAYQMLAVVRGEARELALERDRIKGQLEAVAADKAKLEIEAKTAAASVEKVRSDHAALEANLGKAREELAQREASEQAAIKQARDAEARLEQVTREKVAAETARQDAHVQAERDAQERKASVMQEGSQPIETSATTPAGEPQSEPQGTTSAAETTAPQSGDGAVKADSAQPQKSVVRKPGAPAKKHAAQAAPKSKYQPTYVIEMSDVPWPYTAWNAGKIKP